MEQASPILKEEKSENVEKMVLYSYIYLVVTAREVNEGNNLTYSPRVINSRRRREKEEEISLEYGTQASKTGENDNSLVEREGEREMCKRAEPEKNHKKHVPSSKAVVRLVQDVPEKNRISTRENCMVCHLRRYEWAGIGEHKEIPQSCSSAYSRTFPRWKRWSP